MMLVKRLFILLLVLAIVACTSPYPNRTPEGEQFPTVSGETLQKDTVNLPDDLPHEPVILLLGYVQDSQFDIDRWLIGLDMKQVNAVFYELPTISGMFPRMFKTQINNGMRKGIPEAMWGGVITIYADGDTLQQFTGNMNPNNARVILLDSERKIRFFYDSGFSVVALNKLVHQLEQNH